MLCNYLRFFKNGYFLFPALEKNTKKPIRINALKVEGNSPIMLYCFSKFIFVKSLIILISDRDWETKNNHF